MKDNGSALVAVRVLLATLLLGSVAPAHPASRAVTEQGSDAYARCIGCHSLERNRTGPLHCGLLGRTAGTAAGYNYSDAMAELGIVWDRSTLDAFLREPMNFVPGTSMGYAGVADPAIRAAIIDYIEAAGSDADVCPPGLGR